MAPKVSLLIDPKLLKIVRLLLKKPDQIFHMQMISQEAKTSLGTTFRFVNKLVKMNIVTTIHVGKTKLYKLNKEAEEELRILK